MTDIKFSRILKYILLPAAAFLFCVYLAAQEKPKTVVVLEPAGSAAVTDMNKDTARDTMEDFLSETGTHRVVDRSNADLISSGPSYKRENGIFADEDVVDIGLRLRADYVFTSEIRKEDGELRIAISMMDIETGEKTTRRDGSNGDTSMHIRDLVKDLTSRLIGAGSAQQAQARAAADRQTAQANAEAERQAAQARADAAAIQAAQAAQERAEADRRAAEERKQAESKAAASNQRSGGGLGGLLGGLSAAAGAVRDTRTLVDGGSGGSDDSGGSVVSVLTGGGGGATKGTVPDTSVVYDIATVQDGNVVRIRFDNDSSRRYEFKWRMDNSANLRYKPSTYSNYTVPPSGTINIGPQGTVTLLIEKIEANRGFTIGRLVFD